MSQVQSTTYSTSTPAASSASNSAANSVASQDQFLKLLIAQLQAQDPMNPMDNAQMTSQMAQISTVEGINKLNDNVTAMLGQLGTVDQLNATAMIGHTVLVDGDRIDLSHDSDGNAVAGGAIATTAAASSVRVEVKDGNGNLVKTIDLGALPAGNHVFSWDGTTDAGGAAADGQYSFSVAAKNNGEDVDATAMTIARVDAALRDANGGIVLDVAGMGLFAQDEIRQIY